MNFFKSRHKFFRERLASAGSRKCLTFRMDGETMWYWVDSHGQEWVSDERLNIVPFDHVKVPNNYENTISMKVSSDYQVNRIINCVAFMNMRQHGSNDVVKLYNMPDNEWYFGKITCDHEDYLKVFSDKHLAWFEVPQRLIANLRGGYVTDQETFGQIYPHPYSMEIIDWSNLRRPSTSKLPMLEFIDTENTDEAALTMLVPVPAMPGLKDHVQKKVIFNLSHIDDSSLPVFNLKEIGEAIKYMRHEVRDYKLDLNKLYVRFGKNPTACRVMDLIKDYPNHRFYCSGTPQRRDKENHVVCNTVPDNYPKD